MDHRNDDAILSVRGLRKVYGDVVAVAGIDLDIRRGEVVALLGHNGSGKTTTLWMVSGRLEPSGGVAELDGRDVHRRSSGVAVRAGISFAPDVPALYDDLTVLDHLELVGLAHGVDGIEDKARALLERLGLWTRRHLLPRELSRGMRQKTQLACALLRPYRLLVLDEPAAGLDPPSQHTLSDLVVAAKASAAVLFSTHQLDFAARCADQAVVLADGAVIAAGTYDEVVADPAVAVLGFS